ncbi:histidine--tRNA ligase [Candidatus Parvarchaeota archaeon]|nr:histidine--tRNA ligase [Candidatus Parvarchaeota archaeon]
MVERVKGVRDFSGKEAAIRQTILQKIRESYELFGFEPVETPIIEYLSLFTQKSGEEIESQIYSFADKKGEKLALRPEHTVSKLRLVASNKSIVKPFKAYSIGNVWRYEDPGKGRHREFTQADIDIYGSKSIKYDAEVIGCIDFALKRIGVENFKVHINNRKVLQAVMESAKIPFLSSLQVMREMDKTDKIGAAAVRENISKLVGNEKAEKIRDYIEGRFMPESEGNIEIDELLAYLKDYKVNAVVDNSLVRGIAYYDGNVFEFISEDEKFKGTVASGGRYDQLSLKFNTEMPITGGSIGFDRIMDMISKDVSDDFLDRYCVVNIDDVDKSIEIASRLREKGIQTDILFEDVSLSKALDYCNSKKIRYAVIIGKRDIQKGEITIRDLKEKKDLKVKESEL